MKPLYMVMLLLGAQASAGTTLYKSVDQEGRVTYSDVPQSEGQVETIDLPADDANILSSDSVQALIEEQERADREDETSKRSAEQQWTERFQKAQQDVELAERQVQDAQVIGEGDTVGNALGGARPNAAWLERLEQAESNLARKQAELKRISGQR